MRCTPTVPTVHNFSAGTKWSREFLERRMHEHKIAQRRIAEGLTREIFEEVSDALEKGQLRETVAPKSRMESEEA